MISEVFCEVDFEDAEEARLRRNQRIVELQKQGMVCTAENLYRVDGKRVYLLTSEMPSSQVRGIEDQTPRLKAKKPRPARTKVAFERR
jgi:hypothetical protein